MTDNDKLTEQDIEQLLQKIGPLKQPPEDIAARVRGNVAQAWREETEQRRSGRSRFAIAAAILVAAGAMMLLQFNQAPEVAPAVASIDGSADGLIVSDAGSWLPASNEKLVNGTTLRASKPSSVTFNGGMNVRLNSDSEITLLSESSIRLQAGSVYLDSYDRASAFKVVTDFGEAVDIGTQFMVSTGSGDWSVQVREGAVNVVDSGQEVRLAEGEKVSITTDDAVSQTAVTPYDASWQWTESSRPSYQIEGRKLGDYLDWVARETGKSVTYNSPEAAGLAGTTTLHGSITGLSASDSLDIVLQSTGFEVIREGQTGILVDVIQ